MNSSTKKIFLIAFAVIVVICAATAGVLVHNGMEAKKNVEETTAAVVTDPVIETPTYSPVVTPVVTEPVSEVISEVVQATQNAVSKPAGNTPTKPAANNNNAATKPAANNQKPNTASTTTGELVKDAITNEEFLGYRYNPDGDYYYCDDKECWQVNAGYNEVYDQMAPVTAMFIDQIRIRFSYENKDWMIQFWKGQYGWLLIGAEIGVYTAPQGKYTGTTGDVNHYNCADKSDWLAMQLDCYWAENDSGHYKKVFSRPYDKYWWATGFVKGQVTKYTAPRDEIKVKGRITFKSQEMADLFVLGLRESGFVRSAASTSLVDDSYYQSGADVWVLWSTVEHDCFVGYEGAN